MEVRVIIIYAIILVSTVVVRGQDNYMSFDYDTSSLIKIAKLADLADEEFLKENYGNAAQYLNQVIELTEDFIIKYKNSEYPIEQHFYKSIKDDGLKNLSLAYSKKGDCRRLLKDFEGAINDYSSAIKLNALKEFELGQIYFKRAACYIELRKKTNFCSDLHMAYRLGLYEAAQIIRMECE